MTKRYKVSFEEGWADELLEDGLTQEDFDALVDGIYQLAATGDIFEHSTLVEDLPLDEQADVLEMLNKKRKRH